MHAWANAADWFWLAFLMVAWIVLIAVVGYAATLVALRHPRELHRTVERTVKKA
jgi:hypothetical protein